MHISISLTSSLHRVTRAVLFGLAWTAAASCAAVAPFPALAADTAAVITPRVVYGSDNRKEVYQLSAVQKKLAASTVALVNGDPSLAGKPITLPLKPDLQTEEKLCDGQRFAKQPVPAFCSGALIAPDVILTAGHCVRVAGSREGVPLNKMLFVFDFDMQSPTVVSIGLPGRNVYAAKSLIKRVETNTVDYALIRLDRKVVGRTPLKVAPRESLFVGKSLFVIGHPSGLPTKLANHAAISKLGTTTFVSNLDTFAGSSGSPVFSVLNNIVGVLDAGQKDYVRKGNCNVVNTLPNGKGGEQATRASALSLGALR